MSRPLQLPAPGPRAKCRYFSVPVPVYLRAVRDGRGGARGQGREALDAPHRPEGAEGPPLLALGPQDGGHETGTCHGAGAVGPMSKEFVFSQARPSEKKISQQGMLRTQMR